ncbi:hypothetical protein [Persephonella sp. KM09-Lau-8]|uniref:hypothetical protein n=1 Tax=Persephonella sp. KM09-Lau-8 TaxID=1158345 RepID=UPI000497B113|nr:hypothetical protein [Persephonella sp. KM09-Lau-8]
MDSQAELKLKLSRIYKIKRQLINELNSIKEDLNRYTKNIFTHEELPESIEFANFFRNTEYQRLNKLITEGINLLEKPVSGETEEILKQEIKNIETVIKNLEKALYETISNINETIRKLTGSLEGLSIEQFIAKARSNLDKKYSSRINREIKPDLDKFKEKLKYIYKYDSYDELVNFVKAMEREINVYLHSDAMEKLKEIFEDYKKDYLKEIEGYISSVIKSRAVREKILSEIKKTLKETKIDKYSIYYTAPDIKKHFAEAQQDISRIDIILANMESKRFVVLMVVGLILFISGMFLPFPEIVKVFIVLLGFGIGVYAFVDAAYINKHHMKKFIKQVKENIEDDIEKSIDKIVTTLQEKMIKSSMKIDNMLVVIFQKETKLIKSFEEFLIALRTNIERHIFGINSVKKELELELSEEE